MRALQSMIDSVCLALTLTLTLPNPNPNPHPNPNPNPNPNQGLTTKGSIGASTALTLDQCVERVQAIALG